MNKKQFKELMIEDYENSNLFNVIKEQTTENNIDQSIIDCNPKDIKLDTVVTISQQLPNNKIKSFDFDVIEVWLKPNNMYTIVNVNKKKEQKNFWILFYDDNCFYLKKGVKGPIGVHCQLKFKKED